MKKALPIIIIVLIVAGLSTWKLTENKKPLGTVTNNEDKIENSIPIPTPDPKPNPNPVPRVATGYIAGHVSIGPNCPVEQVGHPCPTPPQAYSSREVIVYEKDGITINEKGKIDASGDFKIAISPGNYFVQINPAGIGPGEKKPVTVKSSQTTTVNFDIDTGIR